MGGRGGGGGGGRGACTEQPPSRPRAACLTATARSSCPWETGTWQTVVEHMLANAARTGANPASVVQSENDNMPALRRP